jgi:hypothetical protein
VRINVAIPEAHVSADVLNASLEAVTRLNESLLNRNEIPPFETQLKRGLKWKPEPPGDEHFDHGLTTAQRGWGDCDDLAPLHAASLRHSGEDPNAEAIVKRTGPKLWHAVVKRGDGTIDDPSKRAGMGQPHEYSGAAVPRMFPQVHGVSGAYIVRPQLALRPVWGGEGWEARTDLPWHYKQDPDVSPSKTDYSMVSLHASPVASQALTGSVEGAIELAEAAGFADPNHVDRLCCLGDALDGADYEELVRLYGEEHAMVVGQMIGSFGSGLKKLAKKGFSGLKSLAKLAAPLAASFVPGGSAALSLAQKGLSMIKPGGGGGGGAASSAQQLVTPMAAMPGASFLPKMPGAAASEAAQRSGRFVVTFD